MDKLTQHKVERDGKNDETAVGYVYAQNIIDTTRWTVLSFLAATVVYGYLGWQIGAWQLLVAAAVSFVATLVSSLNFVPTVRLSSYGQINLLLLCTELTILVIVGLLSGMGWLMALTLVLVASTVQVMTMQRPNWKLLLRTLVVVVLIFLIEWLAPPFRFDVMGIPLWEYVFVILVIIFGIALLYNAIWNWQSQSLRTRLMTTFGFVAMLSILGVAYFLNRSESQILQSQAMGQMQRRVSLEAAFVASFVQDELAALTLLDQGGRLDVETAVSTLTTFKASEPAVTAIWLVGEDGAIVAGDTAHDPTAQPWWPIVPQTEPLVGQPHFAAGQYELMMAAPFRLADGKTAVLVANYNLQPLFLQMRRLDLGQAGRLGLQTPAGVIFLDALSAPPVAVPITDEQASRLLAVDALADGAEQLLSLAAVKGRTAVSDLNWHILLIQPEEQAFRISNQRQSSNITVAMLGAVAFILVAMYFSYLMVQPISQLTEAATRVSEGDLTAQVEIRSKNELGVLANTFNSMTQQLNDHVQQLETRVARRTAALSQANDQLATSELRYRALATLVADYAGVAIYEADKLTIDWLSDAAQTLLGDLVSAPDFLRRLHACVPVEDYKAVEGLMVAIAAGEQGKADMRFQATADRLLWLRVHAYSFTNEGENGRQQIYIAAQDITEQREAEEAFNQAERLRSLGVLAGGIAHDFNNLLTGILGQASLVKLRVQQGRSIEKNLGNMIKAAEHAADLTQKLLAYAGKGQFEQRTIDLNFLLADNRAFLRTLISPQVELKLKPDPEPTYVEADPGQIQQVVMNLILNAANACAENGGQVVVQTGSQTVTAVQPPPTIAQTPLTPGLYRTLTVRDNGRGMSQEILSKIFEPFFTTREQGRGLGLSATLGIIQAHRGGLYVTSHPGAGTTFTIYFPAASAPDVLVLPEETEASLRGGTILVVDDEAWVRDVVRDGLGAFGFTVIAAKNGQDGLDKYQQHADSLGLVIVDMQMPVMNGEAFLQQLRQENQTIQVIFSSGYSETELANELRVDENLSFLQKPYSVDYLVKLVERILSTPKQHHSPISAR